MSGALTWIVQAATLVMAFAAVLRLAPRLDATTRYALWWVAMAAVLLLPILPLAWPAAYRASHARADDLRQPVAAVPASGSTPASIDRSLAIGLPDVLAGAAPWAAAGALALVLWRLLALQQSIGALRRMRARCVPLPPGLEAQLPGWLAVRACGRRAHLLMSADLATPAVLGGGVPIIVLPPWATASLDPGTLDLLVLHEHAHVERGDDRDLLVQASIEAVLAWHPVIGWIARCLDAERERACDDRVVARTGQVTGYARCLLGVATHQRDHHEIHLAPGIGRPGRRLSRRIERLLARPPGTPAAFRFHHMAAGTLVLAGGVALTALLGPRVQVDDAGSARTSASVPAPRAGATTAVAESVFAEPVVAGSGLTAPVPGQAAWPSASASTLRSRVAATKMEPLDHATRPVRARGAGDGAATRMARAELQPTAAPLAVPVSLPRAEEPDGSGPQRPDAGIAASLPPVPHADEALWSEFATVLPMPESFQPSPPPPRRALSRWARTAGAGESIGRGAASAGVRTAGFFSRMGRAIASSL